MEPPVDAAGDERLRELLDVEKRLQELVRAVEEDCSHQVAAASAARQQRLAAAHEAAARADAEQARADRLEYDKAFAAIQASHQASLSAITSLSDERVDELARWALEQVIAGGEGTT